MQTWIVRAQLYKEHSRLHVTALGCKKRCNLSLSLHINSDTHGQTYGRSASGVKSDYGRQHSQVIVMPDGPAAGSGPSAQAATLSCAVVYLPGLIPSSMLLPVPGRYMTLPDLDRELAMSLAASIRLSSIRPGPATLVASEMSRADSLSPSARMTAAFLSCTQHHVASAVRHQNSLSTPAAQQKKTLTQACHAIVEARSWTAGRGRTKT